MNDPRVSTAPSVFLYNHDEGRDTARSRVTLYDLAKIDRGEFYTYQGISLLSFMEKGHEYEEVWDHTLRGDEAEAVHRAWKAWHETRVSP
jgi:hypothetical protein